MVVATGNRRANHWIGSAKLGTDDGQIGGTAVVDLNTKVYGTDNLFVVDASIFPGMVSTNPSALIVTASEHASEKILALPLPSPVARVSFKYVYKMPMVEADVWFSSMVNVEDRLIMEVKCVWRARRASTRTRTTLR
jgi:hypothetical protein